MTCFSVLTACSNLSCLSHLEAVVILAAVEMVADLVEAAAVEMDHNVESDVSTQAQWICRVVQLEVVAADRTQINVPNFHAEYHTGFRENLLFIVRLYIIEIH